MKKQIFKISCIALVTALTLVSCSKKVTSRKLDGEWTVSKIEGADVEVDSGVSLTTTYSYNGTTLTEVDYLGNKSTEDFTVNYSFDKKNGTYKETTVNIDYDTSTISYYTSDGFGGYDYVGELERVTKLTTTEITEGTFTITGGTGEIKANSQIVLSNTKSTSKYDYNYQYFDGITKFTSFTGNYVFSSFNYSPMTSSASETDSYTTVTSDATVLNVESITKDEIVYNLEDSYSYDDQSFKLDLKYTLTQK